MQKLVLRFTPGTRQFNWDSETASSLDICDTIDDGKVMLLPMGIW